MAEMVLFHHALGLTDGVRDLAGRLRSAGHAVTTPDLFEGRTFSTVDDGIAHAEAVGFGELMLRGDRAVEELPAGIVVAGISLGVLPAQRIAQTRPGVAGAILIESCVPVSEFSDRWPDRVAVQIHGMDADPFFVGEGDVDNARALVEQASTTGARAELHLYPGDRHLFVDSTLPSHDADAAAHVLDRMIEFLGAVDADG